MVAVPATVKVFEVVPPAIVKPVAAAVRVKLLNKVDVTFPVLGLK
jgi:hypothetical protein